MDKTLKGLFGFQKFEQNSKLDKLISETESRVGVALADDMLDMVNAAGSKNLNTNKPTKADEKLISGDFSMKA